MTAVLGWDVGGVNTKVARVVRGTVAAARAQPYEIQRDPTALGSLLARLAAEQRAAGAAHAVTMTAELSQFFRTKREGVRFVLDAVTAAFPEADVRVYAADGRFLSVAAARIEPLAVAAANWAATAQLVARSFPEAILIDTGTTTTDIIPIAGGRVAARGRTDHERLREGELVYTGALRTPAEAIAHTVVLHGARIGVSAEGFALAGDVHLWLGSLAPEDYTVPTPDRRRARRARDAAEAARSGPHRREDRRRDAHPHQRVRPRDGRDRGGGQGPPTRHRARGRAIRRRRASDVQPLRDRRGSRPLDGNPRDGPVRPRARGADLRSDAGRGGDGDRGRPRRRTHPRARALSLAQDRRPAAPLVGRDERQYRRVAHGRSRRPTPRAHQAGEPPAREPARRCPLRARAAGGGRAPPPHRPRPSPAPPGAPRGRPRGARSRAPGLRGRRRAPGSPDPDARRRTPLPAPRPGRRPAPARAARPGR